MKSIAIIDPSSYSLPYDYFYITELSKYYKIDFYYSNTKYNYEYIEELKSNSHVNLKEYNISPIVSNKLIGMKNYLNMLKDIYFNRSKYIKIHFIWSIFSLVEIPFFLLNKKQFIFTVHNDVPHSHKGKVYLPCKIITKIANKVVFVSKYTLNNFVNNYGKYSENILLQHGLMPLNNNEIKINSKIQLEKKIIFWGRVEEYKGVDIFLNFLGDYNIEIYGKWSSNLLKLKEKLKLKSNIKIVDEYLELNELIELLSKEVVFILPYKDATQSGVLYTLLAYNKVVISSDVGENRDFLENNGLIKLVFERDNKDSINKAIDYSFSNYFELKEKLYNIKKEYEWCRIMDKDTLKDLYNG